MCVLYCPVTCEPRCEHSFTLVEAVQLGRLLERQQAGQEEADEQAGAGHWEQRQRTAAAVDSFHSCSSLAAKAKGRRLSCRDVCSPRFYMRRHATGTRTSSGDAGSSAADARRPARVRRPLLTSLEPTELTEAALATLRADAPARSPRPRRTPYSVRCQGGTNQADQRGRRRRRDACLTWAKTSTYASSCSGPCTPKSSSCRTTPAKRTCAACPMSPSRAPPRSSG